MAKTKKRASKRRKSKKNVSVLGLLQALGKTIWYSVKYISLGMWYTIKYLYKGISWTISTIRKKIDEYKSESAKDEIEDTKGKKKAVPYNHISLVESLHGNISAFKKTLRENKSTIGLILGARGTGKSALGMSILEMLHKNRPACAMGFERKALPRWISVVDDVSQIKNGSVVLIDEGGILFNARDAMSDGNKVLSSLLLVARHKDLSIIFISQNSSNLELNVIRQADYILLKPSSLMQIDFERKKIKDMYKEVDDRFKFHKDKIGLTYVFSDDFKGFFTNKLPTFWSEEVSKGFKEK